MSRKIVDAVSGDAHVGSGGQVFESTQRPVRKTAVMPKPQISHDRWNPPQARRRQASPRVEERDPIIQSGFEDLPYGEDCLLLEPLPQSMHRLQLILQYRTVSLDLSGDPLCKHVAPWPCSNLLGIMLPVKDEWLVHEIHSGDGKRQQRNPSIMDEHGKVGWKRP